jgi:hypothetical protein
LVRLPRPVLLFSIMIEALSIRMQEFQAASPSCFFLNSTIFFSNSALRVINLAFAISNRSIFSSEVASIISFFA